MRIFVKGATAHLLGNLTWSTVTCRQIDALDASLQRIQSGGEKNILVNCGRIRSADISGLHLLYVWMQCARFWGVELELTNLSGSLLTVIRTWGLAHCFAPETQWRSG